MGRPRPYLPRMTDEAIPWAEDERAQELLDMLAAAIAEHGAEAMLRHGAELVEPTERLFPDRWEWSLVGVGRLLQRLLRYAGLEDWRLELVDARVPMEEVRDRTTQPLIEFISTEGGRLVFQVEQLGPPDLTLGVLCHEVARAFVAAQRAQHPYRDGGRDNAEDNQSEQARVKAAVITVYLGFGLVSAEVAHAFRQSGEIVGREAITRRAHIFVGALPAGDLAFLLAAQLAALGRRAESAGPLLDQLGANQAEVARAWLSRLAGQREALIGRLGLPAPRTWPEPLPRDPGPGLDEAAEAELRALDQAHARPLRGEEVPRYFERKTVSYLMVGALVGVLPFVFMLLDRELRLLSWLPLLVPAVLGALIGSRRRIEYCGGCWMLLRARERACPKCGAATGALQPLTSEARRGADDDDEDDELTRQALAAQGAAVDRENGCV